MWTSQTPLKSPESMPSPTRRSQGGLGLGLGLPLQTFGLQIFSVGLELPSPYMELGTWMLEEYYKKR